MAVAQLTDIQTADIRSDIGDVGEGAILSQRELEAAWQRSEGDYDKTIAYTLKKIVMYYARKVTASGQDERKWNNELYRNYKAMYDTAAAKCGLDMGTITVSKLTLNQNYPQDDDASAESLDWTL